MKLNQKVNTSLWLILTIYLLVNIGLGLWPTVKNLHGQNQHLPEEEYIETMYDHQNHPITRVREKMIPVWNYNSLIYPSLFGAAVLSTLISRKINKFTEPAV